MQHDAQIFAFGSGSSTSEDLSLSLTMLLDTSLNSMLNMEI